jgi:hypothetical protein
VEFIIAKAKLLDRLRDHINERQLKAGGSKDSSTLRAGNYSTITGASPSTTTRDLTDLREKDALVHTGERKHGRYALNLKYKPHKGFHGLRRMSDKPTFLPAATRRITLKEKAWPSFCKLLLISFLAPHTRKIEPELGFGKILSDAANALAMQTELRYCIALLCCLPIPRCCQR